MHLYIKLETWLIPSWCSILLFNHDVLVAHQFINTSNKFSVQLLLPGVKESQFHGCHEFRSFKFIAIYKAIVSVWWCAWFMQAIPIQSQHTQIWLFLSRLEVRRQSFCWWKPADKIHVISGSLFNVCFPFLFTGDLWSNTEICLSLLLLLLSSSSAYYAE